MLQISLRAEAVGARAASRYGYGSIKMMQLRLHHTGKHACDEQGRAFYLRSFYCLLLNSPMSKILGCRLLHPLLSGWSAVHNDRCLCLLELPGLASVL
jgi:hypothetical protein